MRIPLTRPLLTLLAFSIIAVGTLAACGSSKTPSNTPTQTTSAKTQTTQSSTPAQTTSTKTQTTSSTSADGCPAGKSIPQGGGDHDGDNSGGPSDGDGCL